MDNNLLYWIIEFIKVLFGYSFLMIVWPSAVFRKYLKGKSVTVRFGFCVSAQVVLVSTVVLMLGLIGILNKWTMCIFFYGTFIWSYRDHLKFTEERRRKFKYLVTGTFGMKHFLLLCKNKVVGLLKRAWKAFAGFYKKHWLEYSLLVVAVLYGMLYFGWGVFHDPSYAFSDVYTHHSWIYQLAQGVPFSSGIYPEGMHCVVYAVYDLFGIRIYSCLLYIPIINLAFILVAAYCFMKELFKWRYSAIFALIILLTLNLTGRYIIISMARMQCALPQEFAFPQVFLCALFLLRYLKGKKFIVRKGKESKGSWDENLLVFILAFAATIIVHFYATIMAFFLCLGIALFCWKRIFSRTHFLPLVAAVIVGLVLAILPMVIGFASGIRLQGSLYWGMSVIQGSTSSSETEDVVEESVQIEAELEDKVETLPDELIAGDNTSVVMPDTNIVEEQYTAPVEKNWKEKVTDKMAGLYALLKQKANVIYSMGYRSMYEVERANVAVIMTIGIVVIWFVYRFITGILSIIFRKSRINKFYLNSYPIIVFMSFIYVLSYVSLDVGLPMLVDGSRTGLFNHLLVIMIVVAPIDLVFGVFSKFCFKPILSTVSFITSVGIIVVIWCTGSYHGYLYFELTRYNPTVEVTNQIIAELPENSYTIVSPTEELYQVIEYGRHEELIDFCLMQGVEKYTLPTEYVFLFVEKKAFRYAQYHFFDGPKWLAWDMYQPIYGSYSNCPEYICWDIPEDAAEKGIIRYANASDSYLDTESRIILQAKMKEWCEKFAELYPNEMKVLYEDDYFMCYYFKQNPSHLYNLVIK